MFVCYGAGFAVFFRPRIPERWGRPRLAQYGIGGSHLWWHLCVLAAMRTHKADTELQRQCCFALMTIADNVAGNQARVTSGGGIALILDAVSAHRSSAPLVKYGTRTLTPRPSC